MGSGCSREVDRFSHYQKIQSKKKQNFNKLQESTTQKSPQIESTSTKIGAIKPEKRMDFSQSIVEKLKKVTSNSIYDSLKLGKKLKQLFPEEETSYLGSRQLIDEISSYIGEIIENNSLSGAIEADILDVCKEVLLELKKVFQTNTTSNFSLLPQKQEDNVLTTAQLYKMALILIEIYHIIKFQKEDGLFEEGKWWSIPTNEYLQYLKACLLKINEDKNSSKSDNSNSDSSSNSSASEPENVFRDERLKKWQTLAKEEEEKQKPKNEETKKTPLKNLQKPKFSLNNSPLLAPASPKDRDKEIMRNKSAVFEAESIEANKKVEERKNEEEESEKTNINDFNNNNNHSLVIDKNLKNKLKLQIPINRNNTIIEDLNEGEKTGMFSPQIIKTYEKFDVECDQITEQKESPLLNERKHSETLSHKNNSDDYKMSSTTENNDFLKDFLSEASENIKEVIDLLQTIEKNLKNNLSEDKSEENELIKTSLEKMLNFQAFLTQINQKSFTNEISEQLKEYLKELKTTKQLITKEYPLKENLVVVYENRASIENFADFKQSLDNFKTKIRESLNSLNTSKECNSNSLDQKKKSKNYEEIEKELENEMGKFRSIHRKESYVSNNDNVINCLGEAYESIDNLQRKDNISKGDLTESLNRINVSQQYLKNVYDKLIEKYDQIVYEEYQDEGQDNNNLKVIRNTQEQLSLLKSYLNKKIENTS